jgi:minor extracellular serine protease Vpr
MGTRSLRRSGAAAIALTAALSLVGTSVLAAPDQQGPRDRTETSPPAATADVVVVTFQDPPAASYEGGLPGLARTKPEQGKLDPRSSEVRAYRAHLGGVHADFERWLARTAAGAQVIADYTLAANAVAVTGATPSQLVRGPGVVDAAFAATYRPTMNASVEQIGATEVWKTVQRENAGAGIKVGIIDSGIDPSHPFFACGDEKVVLGGVYASGVMGVGEDLVFDHGTHVAGTVAGCVVEADDEGAPEWLAEGDAISGVAPGAQLWDYNVFPGYGGGFIAFGGSAFSHDIAAALEDAIQHGMDVVNLSLGGTPQGPKDFLSEALNATVDAGVVAVVSAGNSGPEEGTVGSPGTAEKAITVGAVTNTHLIGVPIHVDGIDDPIPGAVGSFDTFSGDNTVTDHEVSDWGGLACEPASTEVADRVDGTVTLIDRGACTFTTKIRHAEDAGAVGVLIVNNVAGPAVPPAHDDTEPKPTIPALGIAQDAGADIREVMDTTVTITGDVEEVAVDGDILASFSSVGPTSYDTRLKPELVAPGVNIVSSVFDGGWEAFQGTSMSAPHVAGAAAMLLAEHDDLEPWQVKSALVNTSTWLDGYSVLQQGAGRLAVDAAFEVGAHAAPAALSFGEVRGNAKGGFPSIAVTLSGGSGCDADASGEALVTDVTDAGFTVSMPPPRTLATDSYEGVVTVTCEADELRLPYFARVSGPAGGQ